MDNVRHIHSLSLSRSLCFAKYFHFRFILSLVCTSCTNHHHTQRPRTFRHTRIEDWLCCCSSWTFSRFFFLDRVLIHIYFRSFSLFVRFAVSRIFVLWLLFVLLVLLSLQLLLHVVVVVFSVCYSNGSLGSLFICSLAFIYSCCCCYLCKIAFLRCDVDKNERNSLRPLRSLCCLLCVDQMVSFEFKHIVSIIINFRARPSFGKAKIRPKLPILLGIHSKDQIHSSIAFAWCLCVLLPRNDVLPTFPPSVSYFNHKSGFKQ